MKLRCRVACPAVLIRASLTCYLAFVPCDDLCLYAKMKVEDEEAYVRAPRYIGV